MICLFCKSLTRPYYDGSNNCVCKSCDARYLLDEPGGNLVNYHFSVWGKPKLDVVYTAAFYPHYLDWPTGKKEEKIMFTLRSTDHPAGQYLVQSKKIPTNITPFNLVDRINNLLVFL
jgi:hypothetical protein